MAVEATSKGGDEHFRMFATSLYKSNQAKYGKVPEDQLLALQKEQVERLVQLEIDFRNAIIDSPHYKKCYTAFISYICDEKRNILDARPFFRERQAVFTASISKAFKERSVSQLAQHHGNWQFVNFMLKAHKWPKNSEVRKIAKEIQELRIALAEMNLPLAISRAKIFYTRTPESHLSHMDLVQIAGEGLLAGIDKFCLPFSKVFRGVCIGRITGNFISCYSETLLHFYPGDKRTLYRANKAVSRLPDKWADIDFNNLADKINSENDDSDTNPAELANLLSAASTVSADEVDLTVTLTPTDTPKEVGLSRYAAPSHWQPDTRMETAQLNKVVTDAIELLPVIHQKVIKLRGAHFIP